MTAMLGAAAAQASAPKHSAAASAPPITLERRHWLAGLAILIVLFAPYQTLVQTVPFSRNTAGSRFGPL